MATRLLLSQHGQRRFSRQCVTARSRKEVWLTRQHTRTNTLTRSCCSSFFETTVREVRRVAPCAAVPSTPLSLSLLLRRWRVRLLHLLHPAVRPVFCGGRAPPRRPRAGGDSRKRASHVVVVVVVTRRGMMVVVGGGVGGGCCLVASGSTCTLRACHRLPLQLTAKTALLSKPVALRFHHVFFKKHSSMKKAATCPPAFSLPSAVFFPRMELLFLLVFDPHRKNARPKKWGSSA